LQKPVAAINKRIVAVIDDESGMRKALHGLLSKFGYTVYTYDSAEAFLEVAPTSSANCLIIDIQLGDISGIELGRELAAAGLKFPIVFMSSFDDDAIQEQAMRLGCAAYLRKPFSADVLIEALVKATG
jgi:FixJ family two-component response regulator